MKYIEITKENNNFYQLNLYNILLSIKMYVEDIYWSLQLIEAVGQIEDIINMDMLSLEEKCSSSKKGVILTFDTLIELSSTCDDIVEILLIGCKNKDKIPRAYKIEDWEDHCDVIISREDSTLWQLFSNNKDIMNIFRSFETK